jgi:hypothetical protein
VDTVVELGQRNAGSLFAKMVEVNDAKNLTKRAPRRTCAGTGLES